MKVYSLQFTIYRIILLLFTVHCSLFTVCFAQEPKEPIVVNGDKVEFFADKKVVEACGNVVVIYRDAKLTCDKIEVSTQTKEAIASGNARLEDKRGVIEGESVTYNFESRTGSIIKATVFASPFYGKGESTKRLNEKELVVKNGYVTTCDKKSPHYRISSRSIQIFPQDKIRARNNVFYVGKFPLFYLPFYTQSLKDPWMRVQLQPGRTKNWGNYMLSAWRYYLNENAKGRIHLDYRQYKGFASGIDYNYKTLNFGEGNLRTYYMNERDKTQPQGLRSEVERFRIQLRHRWDISSDSDLAMEYNKTKDLTFLNDYFYREYEKDTQPKTYVSINKRMSTSTLSLLMQKRVNRFYTEIERLPELKLETQNMRFSDTPFYFQEKASFSNLTSKTANSATETNATRFDNYNQLSLPKKVSFIETNPYVGIRQTYFSRDVGGEENILRGIFYSGLDLSTKFYRTFNVTSGFLGMEINRLRHIITPTVQYKYIHNPTVASSNLLSFDEIDAITKENKVTLSLENKLQTQRSGGKIDFARLIVSTDYNFKLEDYGSRFSDILSDLELLPYDWLRFESDTTFDTQEREFKTANFDLVSNISENTFFGTGYRYKRDESSQLTSQFSYQFTPKWKFRIYERFEFKTGDLKEQEYSIVRDLHCWTLEVTASQKFREGAGIWVIFRLKAFPEVGLGFETSYRVPKQPI